MRFNRAANCDIHRSPLKSTTQSASKWGVDKRSPGQAWGAFSVYAAILSELTYDFLIFLLLSYIYSIWTSLTNLPIVARIIACHLLMFIMHVLF